MASLTPHTARLPRSLYLLLALLMCVASTSDFADTVPDLPSTHLGSLHKGLAKRDAEFSPETHAKVREPDPRLYSEKLAVFLMESATSYLDIRWQLQNSTGAVMAAPQFSRVSYRTDNTTTVVHSINGDSTRYRIPDLSSGTEYLVCLEVVEMLDLPVRSLHYRCAPFRTIPMVRPDSILGLMLTLGYIFIMGFIGYLTWCIRVRRHAAGHKTAEEMELSCRTSTVHYSDMEERLQPRASGKS